MTSFLLPLLICIICMTSAVFSAQSFTGDIVACPSNITYCSSHGSCYTGANNPVILLCRCKEGYYGEKCDFKDDSYLLKVVFGLGILAGLFFIIVMILLCASYKKWGDLSDEKNEIVYDLKKAVTIRDKLKMKLEACGYPDSVADTISVAGSITGSVASWDGMLVNRTGDSRLVKKHVFNNQGGFHDNNLEVPYNPYGKSRSLPRNQRMGVDTSSIPMEDRGYVSDGSNSSSRVQQPKKNNRIMELTPQERNNSTQNLVSSTESLDADSSTEEIPTERDTQNGITLEKQD